MKKILIIDGPIGVGKSSILQGILGNNGKFKGGARFKLVVSDTSRDKRPTEIDRADYNFISKEEFKKRIEEGMYLEYIWNDETQTYYGTPKDAIEKIVEKGCIPYMDIEYNGIINLRKKIGTEYEIFALGLSPDEDFNFSNDNIRIVHNRLLERELGALKEKHLFELSAKFFSEVEKEYKFVDKLNTYLQQDNTKYSLEDVTVVSRKVEDLEIKSLCKKVIEKWKGLVKGNNREKVDQFDQEIDRIIKKYIDFNKSRDYLSQKDQKFQLEKLVGFFDENKDQVKETIEKIEMRVDDVKERANFFSTPDKKDFFSRIFANREGELEETIKEVIEYINEVVLADY